MQTISSKEAILTQSRLKELLHYDELTGHFTWLKRTNKAFRHAGLFAGSLDHHSYVSIKIDGISYLGHRLALLYSTGTWPEGHVDHENHIPFDNSLSNLRDRDRSFNMENKIAHLGCTL